MAPCGFSRLYCILLFHVCLLATISLAAKWESERVTSKILLLPVTERTPEKAVSLCMEENFKLSCAWVAHSVSPYDVVMNVSCYDDELSGCMPMFYSGSKFYNGTESCTECDACDDQACSGLTDSTGGCEITCWCSCYYTDKYKHRGDKGNMFKCQQACNNEKQCKFSHRDESGCISIFIVGLIAAGIVIGGIALLVFGCFMLIRSCRRRSRNPMPVVAYSAVPNVQNPGAYPGQNPGAYPVQNPGAYPGQNPGAYPVQGVNNPVGTNSSLPPPAYAAAVGQPEVKS